MKVEPIGNIVGFILGHSAYVGSAQDGKLMVPYVIFRSGENREVKVFEAETQHQAVDLAHETIKKYQHLVDVWAYSQEALITLDDGSKQDIYLIKSWGQGIPDEDKLQVISVGTGKAGQPDLFKSRAAIHAVLSLKTLMDDCADQVESIMQWLSASDTARSIDREIGFVFPPLGNTPQISYQRYNVSFNTEWWQTHFSRDISPMELKQLEAMDKADNLHSLNEIGQLAGKTLVKAEHFRKVFDLQHQSTTELSQA